MRLGADRIAATALFAMALQLATPAAADTVDAFLDRHWQRPLSHQGRPPESFSPLEASLEPDACGNCHSQQLADWGSSLHAGAMGPGLMGQLVDMPAHARSDHQSCLRCHAPLAEQADALVAEIETATPEGLHRKGVVCAACHVRDHQRYGPARRDGSGPGKAALPHGGWQVTPAFEDSRFCAACHQFQPGDFALNGKLLENTYNEWLASPYGARGESCQSCHMPDRRHLWRGIHDPETVRRGVTIDAGPARIEHDRIQATLTMTNSGTGHAFPTYVTPQVVMEIHQASASGSPVEGSADYFVVARRVALDLSEEIFDTRLLPGQSARLDYDHPLAPGATQLVVRVWVQPDFFYQQFYQSVLGSGQSQRGQADLEAALEQATASRYTLFEQRLPLSTPVTTSR